MNKFKQYDGVFDTFSGDLGIVLGYLANQKVVVAWVSPCPLSIGVNI